MIKPTNGSGRSEAVRIVTIYAIFGGLWIYLSDTLLGLLIREPEIITRISVFKGILFIVLTASLLYFLISRFISRVTEYNQQLKASEERFQAIFNYMTDGVFINDVATGGIIDLNQTACQMFDYTRGEALKLDIGLERVSSVSSSSTGTDAWMMIGPVSVPASTKWTVQPLNLTP